MTTPSTKLTTGSQNFLTFDYTKITPMMPEASTLQTISETITSVTNTPNISNTLVYYPTITIGVECSPTATLCYEPTGTIYVSQCTSTTIPNVTTAPTCTMESFSSPSPTSGINQGDIVVDKKGPVISKYALSSLKTTYKLSESDINIFFEKKETYYVLNQNVIKTCFGEDKITNATALIKAIKVYGVPKDILTKQYCFDMIQIHTYFNSKLTCTKNNYVINESVVQKNLPGYSISTPGQLKTILYIDDDRKSDILLEVKNAFKNSDEAWGFANFKPSDKQVEDLYIALTSDEDIKSYTGSINTFKSFVKLKVEEYIKEIKFYITTYTQEDLTDKYGLSDSQIKLFFIKEDGKYKLNKENIENLFGKINSIKNDIDDVQLSKEGTENTLSRHNINVSKIEILNKNSDNGVKILKNLLSTNRPIGDNFKSKLCDMVENLLKSANYIWGLDAISPKLSNEEIKEVCNLILNLDVCKTASFETYESLIIKNIPNILGMIELNRFRAKINGNEFNKQVSAKEAQQYVEQYSTYIEKELILTYRYSEEYATKVVSFASKKLVMPKGNKTCNLKELLNNLKEKVDQITGIYNENTAILSSTSEIGTWDVLSKFDKMSNSKNIQEQFLASILNEKLDGYTNAEKEAIVAKLFQKIGCEEGNLRGFYTKLQNFEKLNTNNDSSWFDEFYQVVSDIVADVKHISENEINNAKKLDVNILFGNKNNITAQELFNKLNDLELSNNASIKRMMKILNNTFEKYYSVYGIEQIDLLERILRLLNKESGVKTSNKNVLSKDAINALNQKDIFATLEKIVNSQELYVAYMATPDGVIDDFCQGTTGDCWLLSAIEALAATEAGRKIISNQIKWSNDYKTVTVTFAGYNKKITLSIEEIIEARRGGKLSWGDTDVLILELATQKLLGNIKGNQSQSFTLNFVKCTDYTPLYCSSEKSVLEKLKILYEAKQKNKNFSVTFSLYNNDAISFKDVTGKIKEIPEYSGGHEFAVTNITSTTVTFVNPWYSSVKYTVSWNEFAHIIMQSTYMSIFNVAYFN